MSRITIIAAVSAYLVATLLTFGYGVNRECEYMSGQGWRVGCNWADHNATWMSPFWPLYWAGRAAIEVTK